MTTDHQWLDRATLVMEYRACAEHYASLVILNRGSARRRTPLELTEAARLNCAVVRARLAEHKHADPTAAETATAFRHLRSGEAGTPAPR